MVTGHSFTFCHCQNHLPHYISRSISRPSLRDCDLRMDLPYLIVSTRTPTPVLILNARPVLRTHCLLSHSSRRLNLPSYLSAPRPPQLLARGFVPPFAASFLTWFRLGFLL